MVRIDWGQADYQLSEIYQTAFREGVLDIVAFDARVDEKGFKFFARQVPRFGAVYNDTMTCCPHGFIYLTNFEGETARIHFCIFRRGRGQREEIGRQVLNGCFEALSLRSLIGVIPSINQGACQFAREMGGREMGIIPGQCWIDRLQRSVGGVQFLFTKGEDHGRH